MSLDGCTKAQAKQNTKARKSRRCITKRPSPAHRGHLRLTFDSKRSQGVTAPPNMDSGCPADQPESATNTAHHSHLHNPYIPSLFSPSRSQTRRGESRDGALADKTLILPSRSLAQATEPSAVSQRLSIILRFRSFQRPLCTGNGTPAVEVRAQEGIQRAR